jgi:hypothetical protein
MTVRLRLLMSVALGLLAGFGSRRSATSQTVPRDFSTMWSAARALLHGQNPYAAVPGVFYPLPGIIAATPFALVSTVADANALFMAVSATLFAWALLGNGPGAWLGFFSAGMLFAVEVVQWTPLHASAYALAPLGVFLIIKPHTGLPIFLARPSWWAVAGGLMCLAAAFAIDPAWLAHWRASMAFGGAHLGTSAKGYPYSAPVLLPGGFVAVLALARWRRPEARLLAALACVPQSLYLYDTVPLALIPRGLRQSAVFTALSYVVLLYLIHGGPWPSFPAMAVAGGKAYSLLLYVPLTLMVLMRPNEGGIPTWLERRISSWPRWLRGVASPPKDFPNESLESLRRRSDVGAS